MLVEINYTNPQWTEKILRDTQSFTKPAIYKDFFDQNLLSHSDIINLINAVISKRPRHKIKVYVQGGRKYEYEYRLLKTPILENETIQCWAENLIGCDEYFILLSQIGNYNDNIIQKLASHLCPLLVNNGIPSGGLNVSVILGKYNQTPFGIHQDENRKCILHYHLGPGTKEMHIWEVEEFRRLTGSSDSFFDTTKFESYAQKFNIEPYNLFVLPAELYHVGHPRSFSVSLVINFMTILPMQFAEKALNDSLLTLKDNKKLFLESEHLLENIPVKEEWSLTYTINDDKTLTGYLLESIENKRLSILSNLGFNESPNQRTNEINNFTDRQIRITAPFKIYYKIEEKTVIVFTRGNKLSIPLYSSIPDIIEKLNSNENYYVKELFAPLLEKDKAVFDKLINFLYQNWGININ